MQGFYLCSREQMHFQTQRFSRPINSLILLSRKFFISIHVTNSLLHKISQRFGLLILLILTIFDSLRKYSTKELLPKDVIKKELPIYLTTYVDKTTPLCMFTHAQIQAWSVQHLKVGYQYLDCGKGFSININYQFSFYQTFMQHLLVIVEAPLCLFIVAKTVWQILLISGHFIVLHSKLMLAFYIIIYNKSMRISMLLFLSYFFETQNSSETWSQCANGIMLIMFYKHVGFKF